MNECDVTWQKEEIIRSMKEIVYAEDARFVSRTALSPKRMVTIIVILCRKISMTVSEVKAEILFLG